MEHALKTFDPSFRETLSVELPAFDFLNCEIEPLTGGRSNELWRLGAVVIKLYNAGPYNPLFVNDADREAALLQQLSGRDIAPEFLARGVWRGRQWVAYRHLAGARWVTGVGRVAQLLSAVHNLKSALPNGVNGSEAVLRQTNAILKTLENANTLWREQPRHTVVPLETLSLIHGDPVPGNVVCGDHGLRLIDWQCPQMGDPAEDIALFLSPAMQFLYKGAPLSAEEEQDFLAAYPVPQFVTRYMQLKPWFHWRMSAYCEWRGDLEARDLERAALAECGRG